MVPRRHIPELAIEWLRDHPEQRWRSIEGSLCFADISGFTALAERLARRGRIGGEELVETLGGVFATMLDIAHERGGMLLKFGGDALLLFFRGDDHAIAAASAAVEMRTALRRAAKTRTSVGPLRLSMSVGVHSGAVDFFLVGAPHRELILLGPAANTIVATENAANAGEILVSAETAARLPRGALTTRADGHLTLRWRVGRTIAPRKPDHRPVDDASLALLFPRELGTYLAPGAPEPEHRIACISFIRFSGADALLSERGPEQLADALQSTVATVQRCLDAEGATLLAVDIDRDGGKFFLAAGVPHAHEDDEGVMLRALRRIADTELPLKLQFGVNRGHVFAAEIGTPTRAAYSAMGDTTNTAARIAAKAPPATIYAHPSVLDQSQTRFSVRPAGPLVLKGKSAPLAVYEVGAPIGTRRREGLAVEMLVGREQELAALHESITAVQAGTGGVLRITAEPGLGKTRLVRDAIGQRDDVLWFRAEPYGASSPYRMLRDPLRSLFGISAVEVGDMAAALVEKVARHAPHLQHRTALLADLASVDVEESEEVRAIEGRFRPEQTAETLIEWLRTTHERPLLIVVDDAQWCDDASAQLLQRLARACDAQPWLMIVTRRTDAGGFEPQTARDIPLPPLSREAMQRLVNAATEAAPLRPHEVDSVVARAAGNPLFATEILAAAREVGSVNAVPQSLEAALAVRVDALDPNARRTLRCAAVLGRSFSRDVLADYLQTEGLELGATMLDRLADFIEPDGEERLRFRSGIVRDTTYESVSFRLRARLHRAAAETMQRRSTDLQAISDSLALHFFRAGDFERAWRFARDAADQARAAHANADAARLYELALDATRRGRCASDEDCRQMWLQLGAVRELAGLFEDSLEAYRRALKLARDDVMARAEVLYGSATVKDRAGAFPSALRDLTRAYHLVESLDSGEAAGMRARLKSLTAMVSFGEDRASRAYAQAEQAVIEARRANEREALGRALIVLELSRLSLEGPGDGSYLREALTIAAELGHVRMQASVLANLGFVAAYAGRWNKAVEWFTAARDTFLRSGDAVSAALQATNLGEVLVKQRRFTEALPALNDALRVMRASGWLEGIAMIELQLARIGIEQRDFDNADRTLERVASDFTHIGKPAYAMEATAVRAIGRTRAGDPAAALELLEPTRHHAPTTLQPLLAYARASAYERLDRAGDATQAIEAGLTAAREHGMPYEEALLLRKRVELPLRGSGTRGPEDAETAARILAGLGVRGHAD